MQHFSGINSWLSGVDSIQNGRASDLAARGKEYPLYHSRKWDPKISKPEMFENAIYIYIYIYIYRVGFGNESHILSSMAFKCMPLFHMFKMFYGPNCSWP